MPRYWVSWEQPTKDFRPLNDPPTDAILGWWCSGYDANDTPILCAAIQGVGVLDAIVQIAKEWPESPHWEDGFRFFDEKPDSWMPSNRFPLSDWMRERQAKHDG